MSKLAIDFRMTENLTVFIGKGKSISGIRTISWRVFSKLQMRPSEVLNTRFKIIPKEVEIPRMVASTFVAVSD